MYFLYDICKLNQNGRMDKDNVQQRVSANICQIFNESPLNEIETLKRCDYHQEPTAPAAVTVQQHFERRRRDLKSGVDLLRTAARGKQSRVIKSPLNAIINAPYISLCNIRPRHTENVSSDRINYSEPRNLQRAAFF